jgi:hypothetical protein
MKWLIIFFALAIPLCVHAEVYKCLGPDGQVLYQALPCADGEQLVIPRTVVAPTASAPGLRASERQLLETIRRREQTEEAARRAAVAQEEKRITAERKRQQKLYESNKAKAEAIDEQLRQWHSLSDKIKLERLREHYLEQADKYRR